MTALLEKLVFVGDDPFEQYRAKTLWTKEPGTITWLRNTLKDGDVFYDIGANIGCYTLVAAQLIGPSGVVLAFEPHVGNAHSLLRNLASNPTLESRVHVVTVALDELSRFGRFVYGSLQLGSSGSSFDSSAVGGAATELKWGVALDDFVEHAYRPTVIKIDVDGNELRILRGAQRILSGPEAPRSVQVEMPPVDVAAIIILMEEYGYVLDHVHYTSNGQKQIDAGADPASVIHNAVFQKVVT